MQNGRSIQLRLWSNKGSVNTKFAMVKFCFFCFFNTRVNIRLNLVIKVFKCNNTCFRDYNLIIIVILPYFDRQLMQQSVNSFLYNYRQRRVCNEQRRLQCLC